MQNTRHFIAMTAAAALLSVSAQAADVSQDAIDACIDRVRAEVGGGGTVTYTEFSQANSLVMLRDSSGAEWRCLVSNDGRDPYIERSGAKGGGSAASAEPTTGTEVVRFASGASGAQMTGSLTPGSSMRYVLRASNGQDMLVEFLNTDAAISYQIFNPDGTFLLDKMTNTQTYRGQLWQSGDHVVEVINRSGSTARYAVYIGIE